jgi:hypothetical protein
LVNGLPNKAHSYILSHCINQITENVILIFHGYEICNKMNSYLIWFDFIHAVYSTGLLHSPMITHVKSWNMQLRFFKINILVAPNCYCYCSCINAQWAKQHKDNSSPNKMFYKGGNKHLKSQYLFIKPYQTWKCITLPLHVSILKRSPSGQYPQIHCYTFSTSFYTVLWAKHRFSLILVMPQWIHYWKF